MAEPKHALLIVANPLVCVLAHRLLPVGARRTVRARTAKSEGPRRNGASCLSSLNTTFTSVQTALK
jgi:hypothetical protein